MSATYTGKNVDAALQKAAESTGVAVDALNYEVLAGQTGGFALIRVLGKKVAAKPMEEKLTGDPTAEGPERPPRRDDRGGRDDRPPRRDDRGGRDDRPPRRDDRGGDRPPRRDDRGGDRPPRRDDRGGDRPPRRDDRGGDRSPRREDSWPVVPTDGPEAVTVEYEGTVSDACREAVAALEDLLVRMGFGLTLRVSEQEDQIVIDLRTEVYAEALEARELELAQALELVVEKGLGGGESKRKLVLDVNGEKGRADLELASTARAFAEKAVAQQKILKLGPLDARARRIVHMTLKAFPGVVTRSEGDGLFRRVGIIPAALEAESDNGGEG
jgi:predicted RNA-binding protein Jag